MRKLQSAAVRILDAGKLGNSYWLYLKKALIKRFLTLQRHQLAAQRVANAYYAKRVIRSPPTSRKMMSPARITLAIDSQSY